MPIEKERQDKNSSDDQDKDNYVETMTQEDKRLIENQKRQQRGEKLLESEPTQDQDGNDGVSAAQSVAQQDTQSDESSHG